MTDFDYDVMVKKRIARGAYARKRGSKSRKCSLPSDGLTRGEWEKRNGAVMNYSMNQPMDWKTFQSASVDVQREYLSHILEKYHAHGNVLADMFGVSYSTLRRYTEKNLPGIVFPRGRHMTNEERARFAEFLSGTDEAGLLELSADDPPEEFTEPEYDKPAERAEDASCCDVQRVVLDFQTILEPASLYNTLRGLLPRFLDDRVASVHLEISML